MDIITSSALETKMEGKKLAQDLKGGELILLIGDLGSGKTTFVQGLAEGLGIKKKRILSPTFLIRRSYMGRLNLEHFDFYRLNSPVDLAGLDLDDVVGLPKTVVVAEWPERVGLNQGKGQKIFFEYIDEKRRRIKT